VLDLERAASAMHDAGVEDRELTADGVRWALVEYGPGAGRADWCETPHTGYVIGGAIEDGRPPLRAAAGHGFALPREPRHRGRNTGEGPARLFIVDALPERHGG
jgi:hypothetical protein